MLNLDELQEQFLDKVFDTREFSLDAEKLLIVANACAETLPSYVDPDAPDFQASPAYLGSLSSSRMLPINFPRLDGIPMDGGKAVYCYEPVPAGEKLIGESFLHEIYDKSGRSGRMVFIVSRMELKNQAGLHLATIDSRMVIREKPAQ